MRMQGVGERTVPQNCSGHIKEPSTALGLQAHLSVLSGSRAGS